MPHAAHSEWFDRFYRSEHQKVIKWLVVRESATMDDAQEATDLAMADLWKRRCDDQEINNPPAYVRRAARNYFLKIRSHLRELPCAPEDECFASETCEDSDMTIWEDRQWVEKLLDPLSPTQREVMELLIFDDLKPVEIAQRLGKTSATVRQNLHHAREKLRAQMQPPGVPGQATPRAATTGKRVTSR